MRGARAKHFATHVPFMSIRLIVVSLCSLCVVHVGGADFRDTPIDSRFDCVD